jgi:bifunctional non-homologous end joining protein LigD
LVFTGIKSAVLDCEVIVEMDGKSKFYDGINQRRAVPTPERLKSFPVRAIVFDLLYIDGQSLIGKPYSERLALLSSKFLGFECDALKIVKNIDSPKEYWDNNIVSENREGFVIKDPKAQYYSGLRMACQLKLKNYKQENVIVEALETNNKGVKITGTTPSGIKGEIQWSSCGFENIKVGDSIPVEYLDVVNNKMVQPHKVKDSFIDAEVI